MNELCTTTGAPITAVSIAQDVIKLLDAKKFVAESMTYLDIDGDYLASDELQDLLAVDNNDVRCRVCALGALFAGKICKTDNLSAGKANGFYCEDMRTSLASYFSEDELLLIERAFEGWDFSEVQSIYSKPDPRTRGFDTFAERHPDDNERLRIVMQNIVDNGGVLNPDQIRCS